MNYHVFYMVLLAFLIGAVGGALIERSAQEKLRKRKGVFLDEYEKYKYEVKPTHFDGYVVEKGLHTGDFRERLKEGQKDPFVRTENKPIGDINAFWAKTNPHLTKQEYIRAVAPDIPGTKQS